jgi:glycosyltransferase involved in cell wall biosynthesis
MAEKPTAPVSVVIPCYRCSTTIARAVASVAAQTMRPLEILLVEDGSEDSTLDALSRVQQEYGSNWIKVIPLPQNGGAGSARNAGWSQARGDYIAFLDADDTWHPQKIAIQYGFMETHPEAVLSAHKMLRIAQGEPFPTVATPPSATTVQPWQKLLSNQFSTPTVMLKRDIAFRFQTEKRYSEDYLLWLEVVLSAGGVFFLDIPLAFMYKAPYGEAGLSGNLAAMQRGQVDTYVRITKERLISPLLLPPLLTWSYIRYWRRILIRYFQ